MSYDMTYREDSGKSEISICGDFGIYNAKEIMAELSLLPLSECSSVVLNLDGVTSFDTSSLQNIIYLKKRLIDTPMCINAMSEEVSRYLSLIDFDMQIKTLEKS